MEFKDGKIPRKHIYWDQAGVLAQVGLLNLDDLPVCQMACRYAEPKETVTKLYARSQLIDSSTSELRQLGS